MQAYRSLILQHFRSYAEYSVEFGPGVNIVVGPNGSGKTNLLEALYVLSTGSSFRVADRDLVQHGEEWFRLEGVWGQQQRILTYRRRAEVIEKQFVLDGAKKARLTHRYRVPVVLFDPDHLRLLSASPSGRRDYLDGLLAKLYPDFTWVRHQYERTLAQRNNVLKRRLSPHVLEDQLFAWDIKLAELAHQLVGRRLRLIESFADRLSEVYSKIAHKPSQVDITYQGTCPSSEYQAAMLRLLQATVWRDTERGFTSIGPHRDDFAIILNGASAPTTASRGEMRSLLLALKIIELELLTAQDNTAPLLLLDDVFSELDSSRRRALAELAKTYQTLITTTDADAIVQHFLQGYTVIATQE